MTYENIFTAMVDIDGSIYEAGTGRKRQKVGIDNQRESELQNQISEMQSVLDSWRPKMVEHGYIIEPKTPEQIALEQAAEQAEINKSLMSAILSLTATIEEMKGSVVNADTGNVNESRTVKGGSDCKSDGKTGAGSDSSVKTGKTTAS